MIDPRLVAEGAEMIENPPRPTQAAEREAFARIVAGSHQLEGINTSVEQVLDAADVYAQKAHNAAS